MHSFLTFLLGNEMFLQISFLIFLLFLFLQDYDLKDEDSIKRAMAYSNVVINCIGRNWETK
jgi:hypothetical protein